MVRMVQVVLRSQPEQLEEEEMKRSGPGRYAAAQV